MKKNPKTKPYFTLNTSLNKEIYQYLEKQYKKENLKTLNILYKNEIIGKLHSFVIQDDEYLKTYALFENNQMALPETLNPNLINEIIHYFYFKEIKKLSFDQIFDFLSLAIFFKLDELVPKIIISLQTDLFDVQTVIFIRKHIFPFLFLKKSNEHCNIKKVFEESEIFLLKNHCYEDFLSFYAHDYFLDANTHDINIEEELFSKFDMMNNFSINGIHIIRLLLLFKDHIINKKIKDEKDFDFKVYAKKMIEQFVNLTQIETRPLDDILSKLDLNIKDFKRAILNEKITYLEKENTYLKERYKNILEHLLCPLLNTWLFFNSCTVRIY